MRKALLIISLIIPCVTTHAYSLYTYKAKDGTTLISTKPRTDPTLKLLKIEQVPEKATSKVSTTVREKPSQLSPISNVAKFYKAVDLDQSYKQAFEYLKVGEDVKVIETSDFSQSHKLLTEDGYSGIGYSRFRDWDISNTSIISQARKVGATVVVLLKQSNSEVYYSKQDDPNNLGFIYDYSVNFYVKDNSFKQPNMLGIQFNTIPIDQRNAYQRNTGAYVTTVLKGSKAYRANVIQGDVVIAVNEKLIEEPENFNKVKETELAKTKILNLKIIRLVNNEPQEIQIPVSFE